MKINCNNTPNYLKEKNRMTKVNYTNTSQFLR